MAEDVPSGITVTMRRNESAIITEVDAEVQELLGWAPTELVGRPSTSLIHPEDQPSAVAAWMEMITAPGVAHRWRGRYRAKSGQWVWVETANVNRLEEPGVDAVCTTMVQVDVAAPGIAEELRARTQLLNRLSDAMPVGLVQFDTERRITLTNRQLHTIVGREDAQTLDEIFGDLVEADRAVFDEALTVVLGNGSVDDLEVRLGTTSTRICALSMRPLTAADEAVTGGIACVTDVTERALLRRKLELQATVDELTGCLNRRAILELLGFTLDELTTSAPHAGVAAVFVDLNRFKAINDSHGHAVGDDVLVSVARGLHDATRSPDRCGRLGGDEFLVVCPDVHGPGAAAEIGERLALAVRSVDTGAAAGVPLSASIGVAYTEDPVGADLLVSRADDAMYASKRAGDDHAVVLVFVDHGGSGSGPAAS